MSTSMYHIGEMPKKIRKGKPVQIRPSVEERAALESDHKEIMKLSGMPISFSSYVKHAALAYPGLRKARA